MRRAGVVSIEIVFYIDSIDREGEVVCVFSRLFVVCLSFLTRARRAVMGERWADSGVGRRYSLWALSQPGLMGGLAQAVSLPGAHGGIRQDFPALDCMRLTAGYVWGSKAIVTTVTAVSYGVAIFCDLMRNSSGEGYGNDR